MVDKRLFIKVKLNLGELFDFAFLAWMAIFVVYGQQAGKTAELMVHASTALILIVSAGFFVGKGKMRLRFPVHTCWYIGLVFIGLVSSQIFNNTTEIASLLKTMIRIIFISFMCAVCINVVEELDGLLRKFYWIGIMETVLLLVCIPASGWLNAIQGGRLGIGDIELNICALLMAFSILGCIYNIEDGGKKYFVIAVAQFLVLVLFQSRTGYLALLMGALVYYSSRYELNRKYVGRCVILAMLILVGMVVLLTVYTDTWNKLFTRLFKYDDSIKYRMLIMRTSFDIWFEKPFWGHGVGTLPAMMLERLNYPWAAHNNIVGLSTGMGIVGIIYYYGFLLYQILRVLSIHRKEKPVAVLKSLLAICIITDIACENYVIILTQTLLAISIEMSKYYRNSISNRGRCNKYGGT